MAKKVVLSDIPSTNVITTMKNLSEHVHYARTKMNITIQDAAALCNISHRTYMSIEKGEGKVRADTVFSVLAMLEIKLEVFDGNNNE